jgi:predicted transcriptional regulator
MLKGEIGILSSIALNKCKMKQIVNSRIVRDNVYVTATFDSMVKDGFIRESKSREYRLTLKGIRALLEFGNDHEISSRVLRGKLLHQFQDDTMFSNNDIVPQ